MLPPAEHKDMLGQIIAVGDYVAYPAMRADSTCMKMGRVTKLAEKEDTKYHFDPITRNHTPINYMAGTLRVRGVTHGYRHQENDFGWERVPTIVTLSYPERCVKLDPSTISDELKELMK